MPSFKKESSIDTCVLFICIFVGDVDINDLSELDKAKAAKVARAGSASSRVRAGEAVASVVPRVTRTNHKGKARCRLGRLK